MSVGLNVYAIRVVFTNIAIFLLLAATPIYCWAIIVASKRCLSALAFTS